MKKTYTKKQITEAIAYWEKQLKKINEDVNDKILPSAFQNFLDNNGGHCSISLYDKEKYFERAKTVQNRSLLTGYNAYDVIGTIDDTYMFDIELKGDAYSVADEALHIFIDLCESTGMDDSMIKIEFIFPIHSNYAGY